MGINFIGWAFTCIVTYLLIFWVQVVWREGGLLLTGTRAKGLVVDVLDEGDISRIVVEFTTAKGEKITHRSSNGNAIPTATMGQVVRVVYNESNPNDARVLLWGESSMVVILALLWFIGIFLFIWLAIIKSTGDESFGDPFHVLPRAHWLFPYITTRSVAFLVILFGIFGFGVTGYVFSKEAIELRSSGIRIKGVVTGFDGKTVTTNGRTTSSKDYVLITYKDTLGSEHTIQKSILKLFSHIKMGDTREVIYLARKPGDGVVNNWWVLWFPTLIFTAIIIVFITLFFMLLNHPEWPVYDEQKTAAAHWKSVISTLSVSILKQRKL
ncbi:hypothetical protein BH09BAC2_BH09BAC2_23060 [soil metagenome]